MIAPDALDLHGVAALLGVPYGTLQRSWRNTPGFPPPYWGGGRGQRSLWARSAIIEYMRGRRWAASEAPTFAGSALKPVANDPVPAPVTDTVAALLAAAGG